MRIRKQIIVPLVACALGLAPAAATAKPHHAHACRHGYKHPLVKKRVERHHKWVVVRKHGKIVYVKSSKCVRIKSKPTPKHAAAKKALAPKAAPKGTNAPFQHATTPPPVARQVTNPPAVAIGNLPGCFWGQPADPNSYVREYGASVLRIIIPEWQYDHSNLLPCVQVARRAGLRVNLVIQWLNTDSPAQVAGYAQRVLNDLGAYAWAVTLGNEQELQQAQTGMAAATPAEFAADWRAAEPVVAGMNPGAIRVVGDISPWGFGFMRAVGSLPGAQVLGAHSYQIQGVFNVTDLIAWAKQQGWPVWFDEGLAGPDAWLGGSFLLSAGQMAGAQLVGVWL